MIWAEDAKHGIGKNQQIPWHLPDDLKYFKEKTLNHSIIMGKSTFDSIGRALPKRENIVLTHHVDQLPENVKPIESMNQIKELLVNNPNQEFIIIGGASLYDHFIDMADKLYVTKIKGNFDCDTFAPHISPERFKLINKSSVLTDNVDLNHTFETWIHE